MTTPQRSPVPDLLRRVSFTVGALLFAVTIMLLAFVEYAERNRTSAGEIVPVFLALGGPAAQAAQEYSGMAWAGDQLVLLPQYPQRALYAVPRAAILTALEGSSRETLPVNTIAFDDRTVRAQISGFEGYEAIAFAGNDVYLTIEARSSSGMRAYLLRGRLDEAGEQITLDANSLVEIALPVQIPTRAMEALLVTENTVYAFFESNGVSENDAPQNSRFTRDLQVLDPLPMLALEYRLTDASAADTQGRFWVINYFFPGDARVRPEDPLAEQYAPGSSHQRDAHVERLVPLQIGSAGPEIVAPGILYLVLESGIARNWEGIARLDDRGLLLITDRHPETLLAFIPLPE